MDELENKDLERQINILERKVQMEILKQNEVGNINDAAYLSSSKNVAAQEEKKSIVEDVKPTTTTV